MTGTDLCVNLVTSIPVIFEPPYIYILYSTLAYIQHNGDVSLENYVSLCTYTMSSTWSFSFKFPHHNTVCTSLLSMLNALKSSHPLQYWHPNNTWVAGIAWLQARRSGVQTSPKGKNLWTHAEKPQGPPNLYNLYVSFPGVNQPGLGLNTHPRLALRFSVDTGHLYLSKPAWHVDR